MRWKYDSYYNYISGVIQVDLARAHVIVTIIVGLIYMSFNALSFIIPVHLYNVKASLDAL